MLLGWRDKIQMTTLVYVICICGGIIGTYLVYFAHPKNTNTTGSFHSNGNGISTSDFRSDETISEGNEFKIFKPGFANPDTPHRLISGPNAWISALANRFNYLDVLVQNPDIAVDVKERSRLAYFEVLKAMLSGSAFGSSEKSVETANNYKRKLNARPLNTNSRQMGLDWTYLGSTMVGLTRLQNILFVIQNVIKNNVPGDFVETGVWRGGASIFAQGIIQAYHQNRRVFVCDSFSGLPPGNAAIHPKDIGWDNSPYLEVSAEMVASNFKNFELLQDNVIFVKGFFKNSMPALASLVNRIGVLRFDGDMYESAADVFYNLYDKIPVGGYIIMDDWYGFPSSNAVLDFFQVHNCAENLVRIDSASAYFVKTKEVTVQKWRHSKKQFK
jgi:hypothetical protein